MSRVPIGSFQTNVLSQGCLHLAMPFSQVHDAQQERYMAPNYAILLSFWMKKSNPLWLLMVLAISMGCGICVLSAFVSKISGA
jgi:hypothetical protein